MMMKMMINMLMMTTIVMVMVMAMDMTITITMITMLITIRMMMVMMMIMLPWSHQVWSASKHNLPRGEVGEQEVEEGALKLKTGAPPLGSPLSHPHLAPG